MRKLTDVNAKRLKSFYEIIYSCAICTGLIVLLKGWFRFSFSLPSLCLSVFFWHVLLKYPERKGMKLRLLGTVMLITAFIGLILYKNKTGLDAYLYFLQLEALCLFPSMAVFAASNRYWLKALCCFLLFFFLILFSIKGIALPRTAVGIILFGILMFLSESASFYSCRVTKKAYHAPLHLIPLFFVSVVLLLLPPAKETPIRWTAVKNIYRSVKEDITAFIANAEFLLSGGADSYSLSFAGYSENGKIAGSVLSSDTPQITIKGDRTNTPLYLTGSVYDTYTGKKWEIHAKEKPYEEEEYVLQYNELLSALSQSIYTNEEIHAMLQSVEYEITYKAIRTRSLFAASYTPGFSLLSDAGLSKNSGDALKLTKAQKAGFAYSADFILLDYSSENLKRLLRGQAFKGAPSADRLYRERQSYIAEHYTRLPDTLPDRVYALAEDITAGADTDYDRLKAIEAYLNSYTYTRLPDSVPEAADVTDYFLFESKNGYCTYFATAMAVLARCEGIPARYVEGLISNGACRYDNLPLNLSGNNAHAWVEAYIPYIGWIPFEPTPAYTQAAYTAWNIEEGSNLPLPSGDTSSPLQPHAAAGEAAGLPEEEAASVFVKSKEKAFLLAAEFLLLILFLLFAVVLAFTLRRLINRRIYERNKDSAKLPYLMKHILKLGSMYGFPLETGETLTDYCLRTEGCLDTPEYAFSSMCSLFQSIRFGGRSAGHEEIKMLESYMRSLHGQYIKSCGKMKKLLYSVTAPF